MTEMIVRCSKVLLSFSATTRQHSGVKFTNSMLIISIYDHDNVSCMSRNGLDAANTISPLMHDAANTISPSLLERGHQHD